MLIKTHKWIIISLTNAVLNCDLILINEMIYINDQVGLKEDCRSWCCVFQSAYFETFFTPTWMACLSHYLDFILVKFNVIAFLV